MQKIHYKTLKVIYQSDTSYDDLLQLSNRVSLHQRRFRFLLAEIHKSILCGHTSNTETFRITWDGVQYLLFDPQGLQFW